MITKEMAEEFFSTKKVEDIDFNKIKSLSVEYQKFADLIMLKNPKIKKKKFMQGYDLFSRNKIVLEIFNEIFGDNISNPFSSKEGKELAVILFGKSIGAIIDDVWSTVGSFTYQMGPFKRAFRTSGNKDEVLARRVNFLIEFCELRGTKSALFALDAKEIIQYYSYLNIYLSGFEYIITHLIERNDSLELSNLVWSIFSSEDDIGVVNRELIVASLASSNHKYWEMVGKLLLSAQRSEGLRQTILESLDQANLDAFKYMLKIIVDNNMYRFSSVTRAVGVWFGFDWDVSKQSLIKDILEKTYKFFNNPKAISDVIENSKNNLDIYIALWTQAVIDDADSANIAALKLIKNSKTSTKKLLGLYFINITHRSNMDIVDWIVENFGKSDIELDYYMLNIIPLGKNKEVVEKIYDRVLDRIDFIGSDKKVIKSNIFDWLEIRFDQDFFYDKLIRYATLEKLKTIGEDISKLPLISRNNYIGAVFPKHVVYYIDSLFHTPKKAIELEENDWKRDILKQALGDRSMSVLGTALNVLRNMKLSSDDIETIIKLFDRKSKDIRRVLLAIVIKEDDNVIKYIVDSLMDSKNVTRRVASLEILLVLEKDNKLETYVNSCILNYLKRADIGKSEEAILKNFNIENSEVLYTHSNGYGIIDYSKLHKIIKPKDKFSNIPTEKNVFDDLIDKDKIKSSIIKLEKLLEENKDYEYKYKNWDGSENTELLCNGIKIKYDANFTQQEQFNMLPLSTLWKEWYDSVALNSYELMIAVDTIAEIVIGNHSWDFGKLNNEMVSRYRPKVDLQIKSKSIVNNIYIILSKLIYAFANLDEIVAFILDIRESILVEYPNHHKRVTAYTPASEFENYVLLKKSKKELMYRKWNIVNYEIHVKALRDGQSENGDWAKDYKKLIKDKIYDMSSYFSIGEGGELQLYLYNESMLNIDDILYYMLLTPGHAGLMPKIEKYISNKRDSSLLLTLKKEKRDELLCKYHKFKNNILSVELNRGELESEVTKYISAIESIEDVDYFVDMLEIIDKETLSTHRFSNLLKVTKPSKLLEFEEFKKSASRLKFNKNRWLEVAMYLPQWSKMIGKYLGIEQLDNAIWWFYAHSVEDYYITDEQQSVIAKYTDISISDLSRGALDLDWFNKIFSKIGKKSWSDLTKYSKHTNGNHRMIKLYSSVILKEIKIKEVTKKIKDKRDKDYVRALGVVPLSRANPQKDILNRYNILQEFLKDSKQFGSQRQESEKIAVEIAMDNLARTANYSDSVRLTLEMESRATKEIMSSSKIDFEDVQISLEIDSLGKANVIVIKGEKRQKSIPAKYKKDAKVKKLVAHKNYLTKQYKRVVQFLENSMINQEKFRIFEIEKLLEHPILEPLLNTLVVIVDKKEPIFCTKDKIKKYDKDAVAIIAHPVHLQELNVWSDFQKDIFSQKMQQPFKQVFRELYLITADEKENSTFSNRYNGYQVQFNQAKALLKSRGWRVNYDEVIEKNFIKKGFSVILNMNVEWFTPADVEAPVIEDIYFEDNSTFEKVKLEDIDKVVFSEVMRDIDLVVSVAHSGEGDIETSLSTMDMRASLARETAELFKLDCIEIKTRHILIDGKLGNYSIHLGSGIVSKDGLMLSVVPVSSQHRGRVFLPFVDSDPKSAEIISKMKMFSEDDKIKDPLIIEQIVKS